MRPGANHKNIQNGGDLHTAGPMGTSTMTVKVILKNHRGTWRRQIPSTGWREAWWGIPAGAWWLGFDIVNNIIKKLYNINNNKSSEHLIQNTNAFNNCRGNPPTNNPINGIADTCTTQNYIKLDTPWENKAKTKQGPQVLLQYGSLVQETHISELKLSPLLF